jgi:hypothetical protein
VSPLLRLSAPAHNLTDKTQQRFPEKPKFCVAMDFLLVDLWALAKHIHCGKNTNNAVQTL